MPRTGREKSVSNVYHIIFRGNDKQDIFYDKQDRYVFLDKIRETKKIFNYVVYAYCLMDNHIHMVIRVKDEFLSKSMHNLSLRYSIYFNKKTNRTGHLFQNRFLSKKVENETYFINLCKYIHRNPESANMEKTEKYKWSSYLSYANESDDIVNRAILMHYFDGDIKKFINFTLENNDNETMFKMSEYEILKKLSEEELIDIIKKRFNLKNASDISLMNKAKKEEALIELRQISGTSLRQLSRVTKISLYYIEKFCNPKI